MKKEKYAKDEVDYGRGMIHSHCGPCFKDDKWFCEHYIGKGLIGGCELVVGEIKAIMWCTEFEKANG